jgi:NAD(P)-dependent dehydrogenase (short-subunit alcohol dehydrogenase family)
MLYVRLLTVGMLLKAASLLTSPDGESQGNVPYCQMRHAQLGERVGTFVSISSCHALAAVPGQTAYCSSKIAAARIVEICNLGEIIMVREGSATHTDYFIEAPNLRCFSLHPGAVNTKLIHELEEKMNLGPLPWRLNSPALTGATILWLTTEKAEFLRGRCLSVNWRVDE